MPVLAVGHEESSKAVVIQVLSREALVGTRYLAEAPSEMRVEVETTSAI